MIWTVTHGLIWADMDRHGLQKADMLTWDDMGAAHQYYSCDCARLNYHSCRRNARANPPTKGKYRNIEILQKINIKILQKVNIEI